MSSPSVAEPTGAPERTAVRSVWARIGIILPWAAWWGLALLPSSGFWATNPQYSYGWLVPPLALLLAWRRWGTSPAPGNPAAWALPLIAVSAAILFPAWIIVQANPGWRLVPALLALSAVAGTLGLAGRLGGAPWVRHFAFPIAFIFSAIPWPSGPEAMLVEGLMRFVAGITVAIMNLTGVPALQHGNLIEISSGILGVDEACSGVRSLQASFMVSLFLGEFYRLKSGARWVLVLAGFLVALATNIVRTTLLSYSAARGGVGEVAHWHDPAGYTILTVCLVVVAILANWLTVRHSTPTSPASATPAHAMPVSTPWLLGAWIGLVCAAAEIWYTKPPTRETQTWALVFPADYAQEPIPPNALALLGCDRSHAASWRDAEARQWRGAFIEWFPNGSRSSILARVHRPEFCLQGAGLTEAGPRRQVPVSTEGFDIEFESMHFRDMNGRDIYVFFCLWEVVPGQAGRYARISGDTRTDSLLRVWRRERILGQQTAELMVTGASSRESAEEALPLQLRTMIGHQMIPGSGPQS